MADGQVALAGALGDVAEAPDLDIEVGAEPIETDTPEADVTDQPEPQATEEPTGKEEPVKAAPGKTNPREVTKMLRELREAHPDRAQTLKELNDAYFKAQRFTDTPEDVQRVKATLEALGGDEGIASLRQRVEFADNIDQMAAAGDPKMIESWIQESPDGFKKAVPFALEQLERLDPRTYAETTRPHLVKSLQSSGLGDAINRIAWYASKIESPELKQEIGQVQSWLASLVDEESKRQSTRNDPRMAEIEKGRSEIATQKQQLFNQQIGNQIQPYLESTISKGIGELAKGYNLKPDAISELADSITRQIDATLAQDKAYQANLSALKSKGDQVAIVKYIKTNVDSIRSRISRDVWNKKVAPFQTNTTKKSEPQAQIKTTQTRQQQANRSQAALLLPGKPNLNDLDLDRDPDRQLFITGRGYLKAGPHAGKLVQWRKS